MKKKHKRKSLALNNQVLLLHPNHVSIDETDAFFLGFFSSFKRSEIQGTTGIVFVEGIINSSNQDHIRNEIEKLLSNQTVENIVLSIDSGGGRAVGTQSLANFIFSSSQKKPITAEITGNCFSAAYWIAAACDHIVASENITGVGSIGAIYVHQDYSKMLDSIGITQHIFRRGTEKAKPIDTEKIDKKVAKKIQQEVDFIYNEFIGSVLEFRPQTEKHLNDFGNSATFNAIEGLQYNLIDEIKNNNESKKMKTKQDKDTDLNKQDPTPTPTPAEPQTKTDQDVIGDLMKSQKEFVDKYDKQLSNKAHEAFVECNGDVEQANRLVVAYQNGLKDGATNSPPAETKTENVSQESPQTDPEAQAAIELAKSQSKATPINAKEAFEKGASDNFMSFQSFQQCWDDHEKAGWDTKSIAKKLCSIDIEPAKLFNTDQI